MLYYLKKNNFELKGKGELKLYGNR